MDYLLDFSIYNADETEEVGTEVNENGSLDFTANLTPEQVRNLMAKIGEAIKDVLVAEGIAAGSLCY